MPNLSYCRFQNTLPDILDCANHINDDDLSPEELRARNMIIFVCRQLVANAEEPPCKE